MGIFDKFKKKSVQPMQAEHLDDCLLDIVKIVSFDNAEIFEQARQCVENTAEYYDSHVSYYQERGISGEEEISLLKWIGCIDILINYGYVCECDYKEEKEDFISAVSALKGIDALQVNIEESLLDEKQSVPQWCETLDEKWKASGCVLAAFDIDSDSYVMFPCRRDKLEKLSRLAQGFGRRIDLAENM